MQRALKGFTHEPPGGGTPEWYTPPWIFERLGLTFDVDVCSPGQHVTPWIPARRFLTREDDGLTADWPGRVWMNPPYGREVGRWLKRFADHPDRDGIALVFARTDTDWFHQHVMRCDAVCFLGGHGCPESRVHFIEGATGKPGGSPGSGSILIANGEACSWGLWSSGLGPVWRMR